MSPEPRPDTIKPKKEPKAKAPKRTVSPDGTMTHKQVLESLSGLLLGMFVSILAGTVVSTSLPLIISDLDGNQSAYTWVVTGTLLATTVSTPLWGKFADLFNRKLLIQLALGIFVLGSALAGFSQDTSTLIVFRVFQGLGAGGLAALSQIIMADIISPRDRGKYAGLFGASWLSAPSADRCWAASSPMPSAGVGTSSLRFRLPLPRSSCCSSPCTCPSTPSARSTSTTSAPC